jgi:putative endonuclease
MAGHPARESNALSERSESKGFGAEKRCRGQGTNGNPCRFADGRPSGPRVECRKGVGLPHESGPAKPISAPFYVYIVRCADGSLYVGHTDALEERVMRHNDRRGAKWTAARLPVVLVHSEPCANEQEATRRELHIKG